MQGTVYRHYWQHLIIFSIIYYIFFFFFEMFGGDQEELVQISLKDELHFYLFCLSCFFLFFRLSTITKIT